MTVLLSRTQTPCPFPLWEWERCVANYPAMMCHFPPGYIVSRKQARAICDFSQHQWEVNILLLHLLIFHIETERLWRLLLRMAWRCLAKIAPGMNWGSWNIVDKWRNHRGKVWPPYGWRGGCECLPKPERKMVQQRMQIWYFSGDLLSDECHAALLLLTFPALLFNLPSHHNHPRGLL